MGDTVRIWYVSAQRLCNFRCHYCVSVDDYAKSNHEEWHEPDDAAHFERIVRWIAGRPFRVGIRLATLGEPFASRTFLDQTAWLSKQPNIDYVELLTNGSLLKKRLEHLRRDGDIDRISLWVTHHHTEISIPRFIENARVAQEEYGCFVVVNALLFPDNDDQVTELRAAAEDAGLRFNLDLGYDPRTPHGGRTELGSMIPVLGADGDAVHRAVARAVDLGADPEIVELNLSALGDLRGRRCAAGHDYFYIGIHGDVFRCSRYQALGLQRMGNVLEPGFELELNDERRLLCEAGFGCGNKEDFLNLRPDPDPSTTTVPSLGWVADTERRGRSSHAR